MKEWGSESWRVLHRDGGRLGIQDTGWGLGSWDEANKEVHQSAVHAPRNGVGT